MIDDNLSPSESAELEELRHQAAADAVADKADRQAAAESDYAELIKAIVSGQEIANEHIEEIVQRAGVSPQQFGDHLQSLLESVSRGRAAMRRLDAIYAAARQEENLSPDDLSELEELRADLQAARDRSAH